MKVHDAVIVGAGHNGLVAACYLARAGLDVVVVEKNEWIGGAAVSRELYPGFTYSNCSYVASLFRPEIMRDLELPKFGLQILPYEGGAVFTEDGGYIGMFRDHDANRREFSRLSPRDAEAYDRYSRDVLRHCRFIRPMLMRTPPDPSSFRPRDISELAWLGKQMFGLSEAAMYDMIRFWTMSISDYLDEYFENPVIKAYLAVASIIGTALGPMSPGTAYVLLHHAMGDVDGNIGAWGYARGGMGSIVGHGRAVRRTGGTGPSAQADRRLARKDYYRLAHLEVPMENDTVDALLAERTFALLRSGVPLSLLLDLAAPVHSDELLRDEPADVSWVHAIA